MNLEKFSLALFRFHYEVEETVRMPSYKGSVLRGGFGATLKKVACNIRQSECRDCMLKDKCAYYQIFETPIPKDSKYYEGQTFAPHPFVLEPPLETVGEYRRGDQIVFHLLLIGRAIDFLPYFVLAFHILGQWGLGERIDGRRGKCFLEKIESIDAHGHSDVVYVGASQSLSDEYHIITPERIFGAGSEISRNSITLDFLTPTRIKSDGRFREHIDFEMLIRSLIRRILPLSYFHCGQDLDMDYKSLTQQARQNVRKTQEETQWDDWSRYSRRQKARMSLGGFRGKVTFEGELDGFMPLLLLGEYIHVGKNTAFGLGKYVISREVEPAWMKD